MPETHWKKLVDTNYLGSWDVTNGRLVLQIAKIKQERIFNQNKNAEESCTVAYFTDERYKPMILNKTNCKAMQKLTGSPYIERWAGQRIEIKTEKVKAFGELVDALRISKTAPKEEAKPQPVVESPKQEAEPLKCEDCLGAITEYGGYKPEQIALSTKGKYGKSLCWECAAKAKAAGSVTE
jgi:hypothetical protein